MHTRMVCLFVAGLVALSPVPVRPQPPPSAASSAAPMRLWPGRADRLIIAPHDLRTADATRAAEMPERGDRWLAE